MQASKQTRTARARFTAHRAANGFLGARRRIATCFAVVLAATIGYHVVFGQNGLIAYQAKRPGARSAFADERLAKGKLPAAQPCRPA